MLWLPGIVFSLAWGAGAFGSNYPWAYTPLLIAFAGLGLAGLWLGRRSSGFELMTGARPLPVLV